MTIENIDLTTTNLSMYPQIVDRCQEIINDNLQSNGGTLKVSNIFQRDYNFTNLIVASFEGKIVGFALVRLSDNQHNLRGKTEYYYLSDIVVDRQYQGHGIGTALMGETLLRCLNMPLVASCLNENQASINMLSKFMTCYGVSDSGKYLRFVDNQHYNILYGKNVTDSLNTVTSQKI